MTGGAGFIGHHLVEYLLQNGEAVVVVDNLSNGKTRRFLSSGSVKFYDDDIRNSNSLSDIIRKEKIETCVHLAAKVSVQRSIINSTETIDNNILGTANVLNACSQNNVKNFVFASSAAVYGEPITLPISETHPLKPLSPYGASKIAAEILVSTFHDSNRLENAVSLRFFNVYGEGQNLEYAGVISAFSERLARGLPPIIYGNGKQTRDFISVKDVTLAIMKAMSAKTSGAFNIGSGNPITIDALARKMIQLSGKTDLLPLYMSMREGDIVESYANVRKATEVLGFFAVEKLDLGLKKVMRAASLVPIKASSD